MSEINVVPYIDVMLVLLVIFMVTAPMMTQGIKIDLPQANSESMNVDEDVLVISITADGRYYMNIGEENKTLTLVQIRESSSKVLQTNPGIPVLVEGSRQLPYGKVVELMTELQQAGALSVGLITELPDR